VDDHADFRNLVTSVLERGGFETLEAETGEEALELASRETPSLVILDVNLPGTSGYAVCNELRQTLGHQLPIMFLSGDRTEPFDRVAGLLIGADDYLTKPFDADELVARVSRMVDRAQLRRPHPLPAETFGLTRREREVLGLLVDGLSQVEIADRLYLSPKTVGTHIQRILGKMGVKSRTQAVAMAAREGLFEPVGRA
jgi:DNA-binding NarL/FixJ family response regulator